LSKGINDVLHLIFCRHEFLDARLLLILLDIASHILLPEEQQIATMATNIDDGADMMNNNNKSFHITVLFFASAREAAGGVSKIDLEIMDNCNNTSNLRTILAERYPKLEAMVMDEDSMTLALNEEYVASGQVIELKAGDTVALIPPISGG
jgi:molybdopterin converting factor subunit 1